MSIEEKGSALEAMNAALGDQIAPTEPEEIETSEPEVTEGNEPEGETPKGEEPEGEASEGEETPELGTNGERERNPDGTWKKAEKPKEGDPEKPAKVEPKKADPVNDPIPKDLKKDTQERIRTLIDTTK